MPIVSVNSSGAIPLPPDILKSLDLRPGDRVMLSYTGGLVTLRKHHPDRKMPVVDTPKEQGGRQSEQIREFLVGVIHPD